MTLQPAKTPPASKARAIVQRIRGRTRGPVTRLMSPSDLGQILKPFVFLDLFDHEGAPFDVGLHPHCPDVSATFTTIAFDDSSLRWLGISDLIAEPEGPSFISRTVTYRRVDRRRS
jgi:hypothetical protein